LPVGQWSWRGSVLLLWGRREKKPKNWSAVL